MCCMNLTNYLDYTACVSCCIISFLSVVFSTLGGFFYLIKFFVNKKKMYLTNYLFIYFIYTKLITTHQSFLKTYPITCLGTTTLHDSQRWRPMVFVNQFYITTSSASQPSTCMITSFYLDACSIRALLEVVECTASCKCIIQGSFCH